MTRDAERSGNCSFRSRAGSAQPASSSLTSPGGTDAPSGAFPAAMRAKLEACVTAAELEGWCWALRQGFRPVYPGEREAIVRQALRIGCAVPSIAREGR